MICDFSDYPQADWMCQCVPMSREYVEDTYKIKVDGAAVYTESAGEALDRKELAPTGSATDNVRPDDQVMVFEIWDRRSQRVYTMCDGCPYFLREPDSPQKVGSPVVPVLPAAVRSGCRYVCCAFACRPDGRPAGGAQQDP